MSWNNGMRCMSLYILNIMKNPISEALKETTFQFHYKIMDDTSSYIHTVLCTMKIHSWQKRLLHPGMMCLFVIISISSVREV